MAAMERESSRRARGVLHAIDATRGHRMMPGVVRILLHAGRRRGARFGKEPISPRGRSSAGQRTQGLRATISCTERSSRAAKTEQAQGRETHPQEVPSSRSRPPLTNEAVRQYGPRGPRGETEIPQGAR